MAEKIKLTRFLYVDGADTDTKFRIAIVDDKISVIGKNAFENDTTMQKLILSLGVTCIEEKALRNCKELQIVEFNCKTKTQNCHYITDDISEKSTNKEDSNNEQSANVANTNGASGKADILINEDDKTLVLQYQAFKDCTKLHTVILPNLLVFKNKFSLIIEKETFAGCISLRTVVCPFPKDAKIQIADDAFYGLDNIVFVTENPDVERFAREHEFHCVKGDLNG